jgi:hypothetical protein
MFVDMLFYKSERRRNPEWPVSSEDCNGKALGDE